jgi:hypothetical protein
MLLPDHNLNLSLRNCPLHAAEESTLPNHFQSKLMCCHNVLLPGPSRFWGGTNRPDRRRPGPARVARRGRAGGGWLRGADGATGTRSAETDESASMVGPAGFATAVLNRPVNCMTFCFETKDVHVRPLTYPISHSHSYTHNNTNDM